MPDSQINVEGNDAKLVIIETHRGPVNVGNRTPAPFLAPSHTSRLVGRNELFNTLKQRLLTGDRNNSRLCALNGLPGVGKTALAIELANDYEVQNHFSDGVLWAGLGPDADVLSLLGAWGLALGITEQEVAGLKSPRERAKRIHDKIGQKCMLLVVDDAWDSPAAMAFKVGGGNCAYIVTTRQVQIALDFADEPTEVQQLDEESSLALLERLAPGISRQEPEEARALVRRVGGLPLALTLMGNYLRLPAHTKDPKRLHTALCELREAEKRLLVDKQPGILDANPDGPVSLQAVIGFSDRALNQAYGEMASHALYAASVFPPKPNTFSAEAAQAVSGVSAEVFYKLWNFGLLENPSAERFTLHQTISDYAKVQLAKNQDEETAAYRKMVAHFVGFIRKEASNFDSLSLEQHNILYALQIAAERRMHKELIQGANEFTKFLDAKGLYSLAKEHLNRAQDAARAEKDYVGLATSLLSLGRVAEKHGDYVQAERHLKRGLEIINNFKDNEKIKTALLLYLGVVAFNYGYYTQSESFTQESLQLAEKNQDKEKISALLMRLGMIEINRGRYPEAETNLRQSLDLATELQDMEKIISLHTKLGVVAVKRNNYPQAEEHLSKGLQLAQKLGNLQRLCALYLAQAILAQSRGEVPNAHLHFKAGLDLARQIEHHWYISNIQNEWGELHLAQDDRAAAAEAFEEAKRVATQLRCEDLLALALYGLARIAVAEGNLEEAGFLVKESLATLEDIHHHKVGEINSWRTEHLAN